MVKVHAHRGASAYAPENTLASFQLAHDMHSDGIECDIHLTVDGVFVVCHDETIDRTSTGSGRIAEMKYADIISEDFGSKYSAAFRGQTAPTLEQMLDIVRDMDPINIEIKAFAGDEDAALHQFYGILKRYDVIARVIVSSFNDRILKRLKELHADIKTGYLYVISDDIPAPVQAKIDQMKENGSANKLSPLYRDLLIAKKDVVNFALSLHCDAIHPCLTYLTQATVEQAHAKNMQVNCWTPNTREEVAHGLALGCDGIITNHPDWALSLLGR
ncbi:MAG: glycerophosphodiester phosphodiesterase family protein [Clostridia bacterium]